MGLYQGPVAGGGGRFKWGGSRFRLVCSHLSLCVLVFVLLVLSLFFSRFLRAFCPSAWCGNCNVKQVSQTVTVIQTNCHSLICGLKRLFPNGLRREKIYKNIKRFSGTPPVSRLSRGKFSVPFVPQTFCLINVELHTNHVGKSRMSRDSPPNRPRDTCEAYQQLCSFISFLLLPDGVPYHAHRSNFLRTVQRSVPLSRAM